MSLVSDRAGTYQLAVESSECAVCDLLVLRRANRNWRDIRSVAIARYTLRPLAPVNREVSQTSVRLSQFAQLSMIDCDVPGTIRGEILLGSASLACPTHAETPYDLKVDRDHREDVPTGGAHW